MNHVAIICRSLQQLFYFFVRHVCLLFPPLLFASGQHDAVRFQRHLSRLIQRADRLFERCLAHPRKDFRNLFRRALVADGNGSVAVEIQQDGHDVVRGGRRLGHSGRTQADVELDGAVVEGLVVDLLDVGRQYFSDHDVDSSPPLAKVRDLLLQYEPAREGLPREGDVAAVSRPHDADGGADPSEEQNFCLDGVAAREGTAAAWRRGSGAV
mmetsp:Transcript_27757/g.63595  ORF Transcript_27757/g.63595 Transcript_27757/m.63595 type:complete len:211 (+) Transcript_27757:180-812(+)